MARKRPRRRRRDSYEEPDWLEELEEETREDEYEDDDEAYYVPAHQRVPVTTILVIVAIGLALILAVVVFRKATVSEGVAVVEEDVEPYIVQALQAVASAQDRYWREMGYSYAPTLQSLYHDYEKRVGAPPYGLPRKIVNATSRDRPYHGYCFIPIEFEADGKRINLKKNWAGAAIPAVNDAYHIFTYIISASAGKMVYKRDTGGQPPPKRRWPPKEEMNVVGRWVPR